jgi:hypothetical protein
MSYRCLVRQGQIYILSRLFFTPGAVRGVCRIKRVEESGMAGLSDDSLAPPILHETEYLMLGARRVIRVREIAKKSQTKRKN